MSSDVVLSNPDQQRYNTHTHEDAVQTSDRHGDGTTHVNAYDSTSPGVGGQDTSAGVPPPVSKHEPHTSPSSHTHIHTHTHEEQDVQYIQDQSGSMQPATGFYPSPHVYAPHAHGPPPGGPMPPLQPHPYDFSPPTTPFDPASMQHPVHVSHPSMRTGGVMPYPGPFHPPSPPHALPPMYFANGPTPLSPHHPHAHNMHTHGHPLNQYSIDGSFTPPGSATTPPPLNVGHAGFASVSHGTAQGHSAGPLSSPPPNMHSPQHIHSPASMAYMPGNITSLPQAQPPPDLDARYKTELCRSFSETNFCRYGLKCRFAHGLHELRAVLRHKKYKTEHCKNWVATGRCPYGTRCRFIHSGEEDEIVMAFARAQGQSQTPTPVPLDYHPLVSAVQVQPPGAYAQQGSPPSAQGQGQALASVSPPAVNVNVVDSASSSGERPRANSASTPLPLPSVSPPLSSRSAAGSSLASSTSTSTSASASTSAPSAAAAGLPRARLAAASPPSSSPLPPHPHSNPHMHALPSQGPSQAMASPPHLQLSFLVPPPAAPYARARTAGDDVVHGRHGAYGYGSSSSLSASPPAEAGVRGDSFAVLASAHAAVPTAATLLESPSAGGGGGMSRRASSSAPRSAPVAALGPEQDPVATLLPSTSRSPIIAPVRSPIIAPAAAGSSGGSLPAGASTPGTSSAGAGPAQSSSPYVGAAAAPGTLPGLTLGPHHHSPTLGSSVASSMAGIGGGGSAGSGTGTTLDTLIRARARSGSGSGSTSNTNLSTASLSPADPTYDSVSLSSTLGGRAKNVSSSPPIGSSRPAASSGSTASSSSAAPGHASGLLSSLALPASAVSSGRPLVSSASNPSSLDSLMLRSHGHSHAHTPGPNSSSPSLSASPLTVASLLGSVAAGVTAASGNGSGVTASVGGLVSSGDAHDEDDSAASSLFSSPIINPREHTPTMHHAGYKQEQPELLTLGPAATSTA